MGVSNRNSKKSLETCCLKNRQKLLHSRKAANDKMSPQKPNPIWRAKLLKPKKNNTFLHFWKHENYYNRAQIKTFPKPRTSRLTYRSFTKTRSCTFSQAWNFYHEFHCKNIDLKDRNYTAHSVDFHSLATGTGVRDPWFQPTHRARSRGRRA